MGWKGEIPQRGRRGTWRKSLLSRVQSRKEGWKKERGRVREKELSQVKWSSQHPCRWAEPSSHRERAQSRRCSSPTESGEMTVPLQRSHGQHGGRRGGGASPHSPDFTPAAQGQSKKPGWQALKTRGPGEAAGLPASRLLAGEARNTAGPLPSLGLPFRPPGVSGMPAASKCPELPEGHQPCWLLVAMWDLALWTMDGILQTRMGSLPRDGQNPGAPRLPLRGSPRVPSGGPSVLPQPPSCF